MRLRRLRGRHGCLFGLSGIGRRLLGDDRRNRVEILLFLGLGGWLGHSRLGAKGKGGLVLPGGRVGSTSWWHSQP